jgi:hypothetical protein
MSMTILHHRIKSMPVRASVFPRPVNVATPPPKPSRLYQLTTRQGTTTFQTAAEWLAAWAKLVRGCKAARALDKLQTARETNRAHIDAVATAAPETAATLNAQLDRALSVGTADR